jgi:hypothetical protein
MPDDRAPVAIRRSLPGDPVAHAIRGDRTNLTNDDAVQLALPFDRHQLELLDAALDSLRDRFGTTAITRAVHLGRSQGIEVPRLPD